MARCPLEGTLGVFGPYVRIFVYSYVRKAGFKQRLKTEV